MLGRLLRWLAGSPAPRTPAPTLADPALGLLSWCAEDRLWEGWPEVSVPEGVDPDLLLRIEAPESGPRPAQRERFAAIAGSLPRLLPLVLQRLEAVYGPRLPLERRIHLAIDLPRTWEEPWTLDLTFEGDGDMGYTAEILDEQLLALDAGD